MIHVKPEVEAGGRYGSRDSACHVAFQAGSGKMTLVADARRMHDDRPRCWPTDARRSGEAPAAAWPTSPASSVDPVDPVACSLRARTTTRILERPLSHPPITFTHQLKREEWNKNRTKRTSNRDGGVAKFGLGGIAQRRLHLFAGDAADAGTQPWRRRYQKQLQGVSITGSGWYRCCGRLDRW